MKVSGTLARETDETANPAQALGELLLITRDPEYRILLRSATAIGSWDTTVATSREEALVATRRELGACLIVIETAESCQLLEELARTRPGLPIVAFAKLANNELVRDLFQLGAHDVVFEHLDPRSIASRVVEVCERAAAAPAATAVATPAAASGATGGDPSGGAKSAEGPKIIAHSEKMQRVLDKAEKVASTASTVLIQGESGTGKELIARWVHAQSAREGDFIDINCGALPENLLESNLFGHEKGSFTGAVQRQLGFFEQADGGTLFLDEIGEMGLDMQVKLLRVLQTREFRRIGGDRSISVDVRVVAATNRDLKEEVEAGRFRADLYYRLNVIHLDLPALRERPEEIPELVTSFAERLTKLHGLTVKRFSPAAMKALGRYGWEGNVRELENAVERLLLLSAGDEISAEEVEEHLEVAVDAATATTGGVDLSTELTLDEVKRIHIARVLRANEGNKMRSARVLEINVKTLYNLIKSLDIVY